MPKSSVALLLSGSTSSNNRLLVLYLTGNLITDQRHNSRVSIFNDRFWFDHRVATRISCEPKKQLLKITVSVLMACCVNSTLIIIIIYLKSIFTPWTLSGATTQRSALIWSKLFRQVWTDKGMYCRVFAPSSSNVLYDIQHKRDSESIEQWLKSEQRDCLSAQYPTHHVNPGGSQEKCHPEERPSTRGRLFAARCFFVGSDEVTALDAECQCCTYFTFTSN